MTQEEFKWHIEHPLRVNNQRIIDANTYAEQEFHRSNNISYRALIARTIRLCLQYPELAKEYYDNLPKATMD